VWPRDEGFEAVIQTVFGFGGTGVHGGPV
jgi:hypothetical protein